MTEACLILVDYANIRWKNVDFRKLILKICESIDKNIDFLIMRLYGGWYYDENVSEQRIEAIKEVDLWPKIIRIGNRVIRIKYIFSDSLIDFNGDERGKIRHTYIERKAKVKGIKVKSDNELTSCKKTSCSLRITHKWLSSLKACVHKDCEKRFNEIFVRYEQKQVDTHMLCDFLVSLNKESYSKILLMSSDVDFMPGIQTAVLSGFSEKIGLIVAKKMSDYQASYIETNNITLISNENGEF